MKIKLTRKESALLNYIEYALKERDLPQDVKNCNIIICSWVIEDLYKMLKRWKSRENAKND